MHYSLSVLSHNAKEIIKIIHHIIENQWLSQTAYSLGKLQDETKYFGALGLFGLVGYKIFWLKYFEAWWNG